jgi:hypothetical protein
MSGQRLGTTYSQILRLKSFKDSSDRKHFLQLALGQFLKILKSKLTARKLEKKSKHVTWKFECQTNDSGQLYWMGGKELNLSLRLLQLLNGDAVCFLRDRNCAFI